MALNDMEIGIGSKELIYDSFNRHLQDGNCVVKEEKKLSKNWNACQLSQEDFPKACQVFQELWLTGPHCP